MTSNRRALFVSIIAIFTIGSLLTACGGQSSSQTGDNSEEKVLNVFNWADYFPETVIQKFEEETGIKVNYSTFSSNEEMYTKLTMGNSGYDITSVTTNFAELLIKQDHLEEIDYDEIPNIENIGSEFFGTFADPDDKYTVPYLWGFYLIGVNERLVDFKIDSTKDLFNPALENSLTLIDDPRPMLGMMLQSLGYSPNSTNEKEIKEAGELLKKLKPNTKDISDNTKNLLLSNEAKAGITYSGNIALVMRENPDVKMVFPKEGTLVWQDSLVIPKDAPHKENALKFIDFINRPEIHKEILLAFPYGTSNVEAVKLLPKEVQDEVLFLDEYKRGELLREVEEASAIYDRVWTEFKQ